MKYRPLYALILVCLAVTLSGCYRDWDYDLTRQHDIYRINYKYKPLPETAVALPEATPGSQPRVILPPGGVQPSVPVLPAPAAQPQTPPAAAVPPATSYLMAPNPKAATAMSTSSNGSSSSKRSNASSSASMPLTASKAALKVKPAKIVISPASKKKTAAPSARSSHS